MEEPGGRYRIQTIRLMERDKMTDQIKQVENKEGKALMAPTTRMDKLKMALYSQNTLERFKKVVGTQQAGPYISSVMIAAASNPKLLECTVASILTSAMRAATLHLSCDPSTGQAYLVPYGGKAVLIVGYKGLETLAVRTNWYRFINADKVYEGETAKVDRISGAITIEGSPTPDKKVIGWVASFESLKGFRKSIYMSVEEIHEHAERYSPSYHRKDSPWVTETWKMERKTIIRILLSTWGYMDPADLAAMSQSDEVELPEAEDEIEVEWEDFPDQMPRPSEAEINAAANMAFGTDFPTTPEAIQKVKTRPQEALHGAEGDKAVAKKVKAKKNAPEPSHEPTGADLKTPYDLEPWKYTAAEPHIPYEHLQSEDLFTEINRMAALKTKTEADEKAIAFIQGILQKRAK